jgi:hypothetical protein
MGIPIDAIPLNGKGENRLQHHTMWLEREYQREQEAGIEANVRT